MYFAMEPTPTAATKLLPVSEWCAQAEIGTFVEQRMNKFFQKQVANGSLISSQLKRLEDNDFGMTGAGLLLFAFRGQVVRKQAE